jgi:streptomycin 3"-adenylyltransferase
VAQNSWREVPADVLRQVDDLVSEMRVRLGESLAGIYLHGSLAMGCFNPQRSDIDLLAVTDTATSLEQNRALIALLLAASGRPSPVEVSFLSRSDLSPWRFPTPYHLHYSEDWRERFESEFDDERWRRYQEEPKFDPDLAAHITVARHRGVRLHGAAVHEVFPPVPRRDYVASIVADFKEAAEGMHDNPLYFVLNACRVIAYLRESRICSKDEGGVWALGVLPDNVHGLIRTSVDAYRGGYVQLPFDANELERFARHAREEIDALNERKDPR